MNPALPKELVIRLGSVRSAGVITGAGVSCESGIPTYRGKGGIYDDPAEGDRTVEALSGDTLAADPDRTWRAVAKLALQSAAAEPNEAHRAIVRMERKLSRFVLLTQNVDGLHLQAGNRNVIDIHGNVFRTRCLSCGGRGNLEREELAALRAAPTCDRCGGIRRPDAVLFGELLPVEKVRRIDRELHADLPDLVVAAGTTALFSYIAAPLLAARDAGKLTLEINPEPTDLSPVVDHVLRGPAGTYLPLIERAIPPAETPLV